MQIRSAVLPILLATLVLAACGPSDPPPAAPLVVAAPPAEASPTAAAVDEAAPRVRLPADTRPTAQALVLTIDPRRDGFSGSVDIAVTLDAPRRVVWLHGKGLHVTRATAIPEGGAELSGAWQQRDESGMASLTLPRPLPAGRATLHLEYDAPFGPKLEGLHKVTQAGTPYAFTQFESIAARGAFPCFDEPGFKIPFDTTLVVPADAQAIANTRESEFLVLFDEKTAPLRQRSAYAGVMAHELAHQWVGDLVTAAWWDDIWLNEAFATWMGHKTVDAWDPKLDAAMDLLRGVQGAIGADALVSARAIRQPIASTNDIENAFDSITYQKGGGVLAMFERWVGPETFQRGVHEYLAQHRFGSATADDFLGAVSRVAGKDVKIPFHTFLDQPGVPFLEAEVRCDGAPRLHLKQSRYLPLGSTGDAAKTWQIPVCARYQVGQETKEASNAPSPQQPAHVEPVGEAEAQAEQRDRARARRAGADGIAGEAEVVDHGVEGGPQRAVEPRLEPDPRAESEAGAGRLPAAERRGRAAGALVHEGVGVHALKGEPGSELRQQQEPTGAQEREPQARPDDVERAGEVDLPQIARAVLAAQRAVLVPERDGVARGRGDPDRAAEDAAGAVADVEAAATAEAMAEAGAQAEVEGDGIRRSHGTGRDVGGRVRLDRARDLRGQANGHTEGQTYGHGACRRARARARRPG